MPTNISQFAGLHTPRLEKRRRTLRKIFSPEIMERVWKSYVRPGLRGQEILDLFDYNDFHWNRNSQFHYLSQSIIDGRYHPSQSHPLRMEKKSGICRTVVLPTAQDSVVLQCIVESFLEDAIKRQPSKNAFFSRSHSGPEAEFTFGSDYIWFKRWPTFSKMRVELSTTHNFVATTDISTFYDNINYGHLRNIISEIDGISEVVLDILFELIDRISWRPDYLPSMKSGLPQVQFDAPRLLAHIYLYEIDEFIKKKTGNCFVRWVDDITFAVDTREYAKNIMRDVDALLQLRGVRLNSGKTAILSKSEARAYFHSRANEFLDRIQLEIDAAIERGRSTASLAKRVRAGFDAFVAKPRGGHEDKVQKRYIGLFAKLRDRHAVKFCLNKFADSPGFRETVLRYFAVLGPDKVIADALAAYVTSDDALDDASIFQVVKCLTLWRISSRKKLFGTLADLGLNLSTEKYLEKSYYYFVASIWLVSKYGTHNQLRKLLIETEELWSNSEFLSRQVAAASAKFRLQRDFDWISVKVEKHGFQSAISVISSLRMLSDFTKSVPSHVRMYCTNGNRRGAYSIQRFLITFRVASSKKLDSKVRKEFVDSVCKYLIDPHYIAVLKKLIK